MSIMSSIANIAGLSDRIIATDFLVSIKSLIQNYSIAITEVTSSELRNLLKNHLNHAIDTHDAITGYMMSNRYYHPFDIQEQKQEILTITKTALELKDAKK